MTPIETSLINKITKHLHLFEIFFVVTLAISTILVFLNLEVYAILKGSIIGLAVVFFLYAYKHLNIESANSEPYGLFELVSWAVLPKVIWISTSISMFGIFIYLLDLENDGYKKLLIVGSATIFIATIFLGFSFIKGVKHLKAIVPILFRAIPILMIDFYILLNN